jgi:LSD1 subclass zinc finger protein
MLNFISRMMKKLPTILNTYFRVYTRAPPWRCPGWGWAWASVAPLGSSWWPIFWSATPSHTSLMFFFFNLIIAGLEMAQLICGGCRTLLMYTRSADTVRCSCCNTVNLVRPGTIDPRPLLLCLWGFYMTTLRHSPSLDVEGSTRTIVSHNETE